MVNIRARPRFDYHLNFTSRPLPFATVRDLRSRRKAIFVTREKPTANCELNDGDCGHCATKSFGKEELPLSFSLYNILSRYLVVISYLSKVSELVTQTDRCICPVRKQMPREKERCDVGANEDAVLRLVNESRGGCLHQRQKEKGRENGFVSSEFRR